MNDVNTVLNVAMFLLVAVVAVPVLRSKRKDGIIDEQAKVIESHERRINALEQDLKGAQDRANEVSVALAEANNRAAAAEARYEEQLKYTARPAVEQFERMLLDHQRGVQERHELMIEALKRQTAALDELLRHHGGIPPRTSP